ncbi:hypothetical protein NUACC21_18680 [Scytonema sp. NUACC21]
MLKLLLIQIIKFFESIALLGSIAFILFPSQKVTARRQATVEWLSTAAFSEGKFKQVFALSVLILSRSLISQVPKSVN